MTRAQVSMWALACVVLSGCSIFKPDGALTAGGLCGGSARAGNQSFCDDLVAARAAFYRKDWERAATIAKRLDDARPGYEELRALLADSKKALADGDTGPWNFRLRRCPDKLPYPGTGMRTLLAGDVFQLLRCRQVQFWASRGVDDLLDSALEDLQLARAAPGASALLRGVLVHACARVVARQSRPVPERTLRCLWEARNLDPTAIQNELVGLTPSERSNIVRRLETDRKTLKARADRDHAADSLERRVFLASADGALAAHAAYQRQNREALEAVARFERKLREGDFGTCVERLAPRLQRHLRGSKGRTPAAVLARLDRDAGLALASALARCHYFAERPAAAAALLVATRDATASTSFAERRYRAERRTIAQEKGVVALADRLKPPRFPRDETAQRWREASEALPESMIRVRGKIAKVERTAQGATIHFAPARLRTPATTCTPTDRIARITAEGLVRYARSCRTKRGRARKVALDPIPVSDAKGLVPGALVEIIRPEGRPGAVLYAWASTRRRAPLIRFADAVLD